MDYYNTVIINEQKKRSSASNSVYRNVLENSAKEIFGNFKFHTMTIINKTFFFFSFEIYFQRSGRDHLCFFSLAKKK